MPRSNRPTPIDSMCWGLFLCFWRLLFALLCCFCLCIFVSLRFHFDFHLLFYFKESFLCVWRKKAWSWVGGEKPGRVWKRRKCEQSIFLNVESHAWEIFFLNSFAPPPPSSGHCLAKGNSDFKQKLFLLFAFFFFILLSSDLGFPSLLSPSRVAPLIKTQRQKLGFNL